MKVNELKNLKKSGILPLVIIVVLAGALFIYYPEASLGSSAFTITVNYEDGTKEVINPYAFSSKFKLVSILKDDVGVSSIFVGLRMKASWDGEASSSVATGSVVFTLNGGAKLTSIVNYPSVPNGKLVNIWGKTITAGTLEGWDSTLGPKTLTISGNVDLDVTSSDGSTDSRSADLSATWQYEVVDPDTTPPTTNMAPIAEANGPYSGTTGSAVSFSSSGSKDSDGTIASYRWTFGDGGTSSSANPSHTYNFAGTYSVKLTVTDNDGAKDTDTAQAFITAPADPPAAVNNPPVARANGPYSGSSGASVYFSSGGSYDPDGSIVSYYWTFGDGGASTSANPRHTYPVTPYYMVYQVKLRVTDNDGATDTDTTTASISDSGLIDLSIIKAGKITSQIHEFTP